MAAMIAKHDILLPDGEVIPQGSMFDATPEQARQFDHLNAARAATAAEVKAAKDGRA